MLQQLLLFCLFLTNILKMYSWLVDLHVLYTIIVLNFILFLLQRTSLGALIFYQQEDTSKAEIRLLIILYHYSTQNISIEKKKKPNLSIVFALFATSFFWMIIRVNCTWKLAWLIVAWIFLLQYVSWRK